MKATNLRANQVILRDGVLFRVMHAETSLTGRGRSHVQTKLRNLVDGTQNEVRFRSDDDVEVAEVSTREMQYLYADGEAYTFMDKESFEQLALSRELLGDAVQYLIPETVALVQVHDGSPVGVDLPAVVELKVVETVPAIKGATASAQKKPATMETGLVVQVPPFIDEGETLRISTLDGSYVGRLK